MPYVKILCYLNLRQHNGVTNMAGKILEQLAWQSLKSYNGVLNLSDQFPVIYIMGVSTEYGAYR